LYYYVCTAVWLLVHVFAVLQLVDALRHLPGRKLVPRFHAFLLATTQRVALSGFLRAVTSGALASWHGDPESPNYYRNERLRFGWVAPVFVQLALRFISPASVWRVRRVLSEWGLDKEVHYI